MSGRVGVNVRKSGKEGGKGKKRGKKVLTIGGEMWYSIRALMRRGPERGRGGRGNLENDTEKREKRQLILK